MELLVLNREFESIDIIDTFESAIWTDRYNTCGDFELYLPMDVTLLNSLKMDHYLWLSESEHCMIISDIKIESSVEDGNHLIVTGESLESILKRRVVWGEKLFQGNLQDAVETMLNDAIISPSIEERKIDNFIFESSTDEKITSLEIDTQYMGNDLYSVISGLCEEYQIGFKIILNDNNQLVFSLYAGVDRSYDQFENPYVIFSPNFENILNSNYFSSNADLKNVTFIAGEGEGVSRITASAGTGSGLSRREIFTDASSVSSETDEYMLSEAEYISLLESKGRENLDKYNLKTAFDGEMEATQLYRYGEDFFIGDIVQFANEYGHEGRVYISELIFAQDESGLSIYPTFKSTEKEGDV